MCILVTGLKWRPQGGTQNKQRASVSPYWLSSPLTACRPPEYPVSASVQSTNSTQVFDALSAVLSDKVVPDLCCHMVSLLIRPPISLSWAACFFIFIYIWSLNLGYIKITEKLVVGSRSTCIQNLYQTFHFSMWGNVQTSRRKFSAKNVTTGSPRQKIWDLPAVHMLKIIHCLIHLSTPSLRPRQNGRHFPDDVLHFLEWKCLNFQHNLTEVCS